MVCPVCAAKAWTCCGACGWEQWTAPDEPHERRSDAECIAACLVSSLADLDGEWRGVMAGDADAAERQATFALALVGM